VVTAEVNPMMVMLARESRHLTQSALARALHVRQGTLSKIENGQIQPSPQLLKALADFLSYPAELFFEEEPFRNLPISFYRKRILVSSTTLKAVTAQLNIFRMQLRKLLRSAEIPDLAFTRIDLKELRGNVDQVAREIRLNWHLPPGPIKNVTRTLENAGVVIFKCDFATNKIDAISIFDSDNLHPMILMNATLPGDRWRFTLCHEFAHILFHHHLPALAQDGDIETQADRFASELLMPSKEIKAHLQNPTLKKLATLKPYWRVSIQSLMEKAYSLGQISERQRRYLWMQMGKYGYRLKEPFPIEQEEPTLVSELIRFHLEYLKYSEKQLAQSLRLNEVDFQRQYLGVTKPPLRLVKTPAKRIKA
jgi:Zn-dependent peptidase ImmA (M78 family)/DNA-binding XRE family transcriptional regulator